MLYFVIFLYMNKILWHNRARKQIKKIPQNFRNAIIESIDQLVAFPECDGLDIIRLKKHRYDYRMRIGRYRVLFDHDDGIKIIGIQEVKKRDEQTY